MSLASKVIEFIEKAMDYEPYVKTRRSKECPYCHQKFSPQNVVDYMVHLRQHKKHESFDEKLVQVGVSNPYKSIETLDSYGWDRTPSSNRYTHDSLPGHQIHVTPHYIRHTHHGIGVNVHHDDVQKYVRGLHQSKFGKGGADWDAGEGEED
jgi:hypothetical protein